MRNLLENNISQMWFNVQKMESTERKAAIKYIIGLHRNKSGFVEYKAKYFLAGLIDASECYYNQTGINTPVKEFKKLGWYDEKNNLIFDKIMN